MFLRLYAADETGAFTLSDAIYADVPNMPAAPFYAALGEYGSAEYTFSIELGAWTDDGLFDGLAVSSWSYTALAPYISTADSAFVPGSVSAQVLAPMSYTVPEPGSGLLLLLGGALLALRRRARG